MEPGVLLFVSVKTRARVYMATQSFGCELDNNYFSSTLNAYVQFPPSPSSSSTVHKYITFSVRFTWPRVNRSCPACIHFNGPTMNQAPHLEGLRNGSLNVILRQPEPELPSLASEGDMYIPTLQS